MYEPFRLLAVNIDKKCDPKFAKRLEPGELFCFYSNYQIRKNDDGELSEIAVTEDVIDHLFLTTLADGKELPVNISAVVGKNGSGKSTLFEILFQAIYVAASIKGVLEINLKKLEEELDLLMKQPDDQSEKIAQCRKAIEDLTEIQHKLFVDIIYQAGQEIRVLKLAGGDLRLAVFTVKTAGKHQKVYRMSEEKTADQFELDEVFYSIAVNYSIHGLNDKRQGSWLSYLFHKNDGYQTPVVINPFRREGNIDVNSEFHLAQSRVLANLFDESMKEKRVIDDRTVKEIVFKYDAKKLNSFGIIKLDTVLKKLATDQDRTHGELFAELYQKLTGVPLTQRVIDRTTHFEGIVQYALKKLFKISARYQDYEDFYHFPKDVIAAPELKDWNGLLDKLAEDHSHVTMKLRQLMNTVRFGLLRESPRRKITWKDDKLTIALKDLGSRSRAALRILQRSGQNDQTNMNNTLELVPAAFFRPHIKLSDNMDIYRLSSGEQQLIHIFQSIIYHLINLDTLFKKPAGKTLRFRHVNIMLDEIELYFHPQLQRDLISELLLAISKLKLDGIDGINILCATHSPFILSDIPGVNILKMDKGRPYENTLTTFGANIHDLLADPFFLTDSFMGTMARQTINELINHLQPRPAENAPADKQIDLSTWSSDDIRRLIGHIGEPLIRNSLMELFYHANSDLLQLEIDRLTQIQNSRRK